MPVPDAAARAGRAVSASRRHRRFRSMVDAMPVRGQFPNWYLAETPKMRGSVRK